MNLSSIRSSVTSASEIVLNTRCSTAYSFLLQLVFNHPSFTCLPQQAQPQAQYPTTHPLPSSSTSITTPNTHSYPKTPHGVPTPYQAPPGDLTWPSTNTPHWGEQTAAIASSSSSASPPLPLAHTCTSACGRRTASRMC